MNISHAEMNLHNFILFQTQVLPFFNYSKCQTYEIHVNQTGKLFVHFKLTSQFPGKISLFIKPTNQRRRRNKQRVTTDINVKLMKAQVKASSYQQIQN